MTPLNEWCVNGGKLREAIHALHILQHKPQLREPTDLSLNDNHPRYFQGWLTAVDQDGEILIKPENFG